MTASYPPLVIPLALLLWSWQTGAWIAGLALAVWFEWLLRTSWRWRITENNLKRLVDLTSLLVAAVVVFEYSRGPLSAGIFSALRWSPLWLAALVSVQILSARQGVSYRALFLSQRRSRSPEADRLLDLKPVYLGACLLAAGIGGGSQIPFGYLGSLLAFCAWVCVWQLGPALRRRWPAVLLMLTLAGALAVVGQQGLTQTQRRLEDLAVTWMTGFFFGDKDPYRAHTALGDIGELKLSDRVLYRVTTDQPLTQALLLRTASYDRYAANSWLTRERDFTAVAQVQNGWQWSSGPSSEHQQSAWIGSYLQRRGHLLPLPTGAWRLDELPVGSVERLSLGAVKVSDGPPLIHFRALYAESSASDRPPDDADLLVPAQEQAVLQRLVDELDLSEQDTLAKVARIRRFFSNEFRYTLTLPGPTPGQTAIGHFLTDSRRGHCEFFASATALLLRQAGVPARYAVGYSVQEPDSAPNSYKVRRSHAHAWTLFWQQGRWWDLDTTPAIWADLEADDRPFWQPVADWFSRLWYRFNLSRLEPDQRTPTWVWVLLALLFALLAYRLRLGQRWSARQGRRRNKHPAPPNSPIAPLAAVLTRAGWPRRAGETDRQWLLRIRATQRLDAGMPPVEALVELNERARYRPGGLDDADSDRLRTEIAHWLSAWKSRPRDTIGG